MRILKIGSSGPLVKFLQLSLNNALKSTLVIDGIFGRGTEVAVKRFQSINMLDETGIVDSVMWNQLLPYTTFPDNIEYSYDIMMINIEYLLTTYSFISKGVIGLSGLEREIPFIKIGNGPKEIIYVASIHANEWITSPVLMKFLFDYCLAYSSRSLIFNVSAEQLYSTSTLYIVPMLNSDGVDLVTGDLGKNSPGYVNALDISKNYPGISFPSGWKANIFGIDLNLQFPALWEQAKEIKYAQGFVSPAPRDFVGDYPLQSSEAISIYDFILSHKSNLILTYHSQGEVIYWKFANFNPPNALYIGEVFSDISGYLLSNTPYSSAFAGLKDWFIQNYNLPGYTIEVGSGKNPLPISQFTKIYDDNIGILVNGILLA